MGKEGGEKQVFELPTLLALMSIGPITYIFSLNLHNHVEKRTLISQWYKEGS